MADIIYIRQGSTAQIPFQLLSNDAPIDLTGVNKVELILVPQNGAGTLIDYNTTDDATRIAILSATQGRVGYTPSGLDITNADSPYKIFFWVWSSGSTKYAVPDKEELSIQVTDNYA